MPDNILVDTDVIIWLLRGDTEALKQLQTYPGISFSAVTYMELLQGIKNKKEFTQLRAFIQDWDIDIKLINDRITMRAMTLCEEFSLSHNMHLSDALIGATATAYALPLLTGNVKRYTPIQSLELRPFKRANPIA